MNKYRRYMSQQKKNVAKIVIEKLIMPFTFIILLIMIIPIINAENFNTTIRVFVKPTEIKIFTESGVSTFSIPVNSTSNNSISLILKRNATITGQLDELLRLSKSINRTSTTICNQSLNLLITSQNKFISDRLIPSADELTQCTLEKGECTAQLDSCLRIQTERNDSISDLQNTYQDQIIQLSEDNRLFAWSFTGCLFILFIFIAFIIKERFTGQKRLRT